MVVLIRTGDVVLENLDMIHDIKILKVQVQDIFRFTPLELTREKI